ncbi:hypothetical protein G9A89_013258 [Geosiphon pyriformis]|nr:hypothetical protein G9A89_013258 [Geosiphon pyriformis]
MAVVDILLVAAVNKLESDILVLDKLAAASLAELAVSLRKYGITCRALASSFGLCLVVVMVAVVVVVAVVIAEVVLMAVGFADLVVEMAAEWV